jgi:ribosomal protein L29
VFFIKINDIRALPDSALLAKEGELALELAIERRNIAATGVSSKIIKVRSIRRTIARIQTILKERGAKE